MNIKEQMDLLQMKEITTERQKKNGTRIFRLPIKMYGEYIEIGSFKSGYVRRMNGGYTPYQLNKREITTEKWPKYKTYWSDDPSEGVKKIEVRQASYENIQTNWAKGNGEDSIGAVCFGKNELWFSEYSSIFNIDQHYFTLTNY